MRILVAPDKFKGSMTGQQAGDAMRAGLLRVWPDAQVDVVPVADGGDGTATAMLDAVGGRRVTRTVSGPDGRPVDAWFALLGDGRTAVVELAAASGLVLVPAGKNDPMTATTFGTGELIAAAIDEGARRIVSAIGGSATNDAGAGALSALGARFLDASGSELPRGGGALARLESIDDSALAARIRGVTIEIACDVDNPLVGPNGASAIYGPQKGATPDDVRVLDGALSHFADVVAQKSGADVRSVPGGGAAGGIAAGFLALAGARLERGADLVFDVIGFDKRLDGVSLVVTGEGRLDRQTLAGKAPSAVASAAAARGIPAVAVAGTVDLRGDDLEKLHLLAAEPLVTGTPSADDMRRARELTANSAERLARRLKDSSLITM
ncbi:MAG TPA: glycerate kinase [Candidatus Eremiobacteraceae bacterium]|nr:glycerate kinase [Candidatus Eremiobacteraceae bacterium]